MGLYADIKRGVKCSSDGSFDRVLNTISDVANSIMVDADAGDEAIDLEPRLEVEDGTIG